jgi:nicotinate-nucleotide adenylyltransferase
MRIGLFGGSFNPIHAGHLLVAEQCLKRLRLDAVWLLVSPGNPLKDHGDLAPLIERVAAARALARDPRLAVTGYEAVHGFSYTYDTLSHLKTTLPGRRFVWIMGADSMAGLHRWERWRDLARLMPMAVYVRPGSARSAFASRAAVALARWRRDESDAPILADLAPPAWIYLHGVMSTLSSTAIRNTRKIPAPAALAHAGA